MHIVCSTVCVILFFFFPKNGITCTREDTSVQSEAREAGQNKKEERTNAGTRSKSKQHQARKNNGARAKDAHPSIKPRKRGRRKQIAMPDAGKTENRARPSKWPQAL